MLNILNREAIQTRRGARLVVRVEGQTLQAVYGLKAAPCAVLQPRCQQMIFSRAPASMGFGRPASSSAAQP